MVKDPLCGLHIPVDRAVVKQIGGESRYFCSEECAGQFSVEKVWPHE
jgi:YHS domain-containing protein